MKKTLILAMSLLVMASCGQKNSDKKTDDSAAATSETVTASQEPVYYLTKDGIGPVKIGMEWKDVPPLVEGLYDMRKEVSYPDCVGFMFLNGDSESFAAYDFGEGKLDVICLFDSVINVKAPRGDFHLGSPFSKVLELPGVTAEWNSIDEEGQWYWVWEGLWIGVGQSDIGTALSTRLYNSTQAPTVSDFTGNEKIGFIGTGLPY